MPANPYGTGPGGVPGPHVKPTKKQQAEILHSTRGMLSRALHDWEIKALIHEKYGLSKKSLVRYLSRARREMQEDRGWDQKRSLDFYVGVIRDPKASTKEQIFAAKRIDGLLGLEAPKKQIIMPEFPMTNLTPDQIEMDMDRRTMGYSGEPAFVPALTGGNGKEKPDGDEAAE